MVVERIFPLKEIRRNPSRVAALGFVFVCISVILANMAHQPPMGFFIIALTVIPAIPFFLRMTIWEEKGEEMYVTFISAIPKSKSSKGMKGISHIYNDIIKLYVYFFFGCIIGFAFTSSVMPAEASKSMFSDLQFPSTQLPDITISGIFLHNFQLMLIMVLFSLVYSVGAVFLLVLNAAAIGLFLQTGIRQNVSNFYSLGVLSYPAAFFAGSFNGIIKLLPHGICEFSGFFIASVAGGILSVAIERKAYKRWAVLKILLIDVAKLLILATLLIAVGAWIESSYTTIESILPSFLK
jgi:uncharacterized membrane protein SpoIIM required for sporulation